MSREPDLSGHHHSRIVERAGGVAWRLGLVTILFLTFFPFLFMLMTAMKDTHQFYHSFWLPTWPPHLDNFVTAFGDMKFYIFNSLLVTGLSVSFIALFSTIGGFLFARYAFPGRELLYYGIIAIMMIPGALMLIPSFVWVSQLNLIDTYFVMVLPYIAGGQIMGIYLLRGFFGQIDNALFEASQVDGAGLFRQIWHIALPLAKPVLGVVAIISSLGVWNQFLWPLVTTSSEGVMVLTIGMLRYNSRVGGQYGLMFAGYTISAIPLGILFVLTTRTFMKGITSGALKA